MAWSWLQPASDMRALSKEAAYEGVVKTMRSRVAWWMENFEDSPERATGWFHNYVCPKCASPLIFDRTKPDVFRCKACGYLAEGTDKIIRAWTYFRRHDISEAVVDAAILYHMEGGDAYRDFILRVIDAYATDYPKYDESGEHAGRGKVMGQSLDEAVWAINFLKALITIQFDATSEQGQYFYQHLFLPVSRLTVAQTGMIHNIPLWHASCALATGMVFGDERLISQTVGGVLGLANQILEGFTADGIWYENSTGYHNYSLRAASSACLFARWKGYTDERFLPLYQRVIDAYTALLQLRYRDDTLPAFNDTSRNSPKEGMQGSLDSYLFGARLFEGMPGVEKIAAVANEYDARGTMGAFLYGVPAPAGAIVPPGSVNLPSNRMGMLRSPEAEVYVKYGNLTPSHAHPDALSISIAPLSLDLGTSGYGSPFHGGWYTQTVAHNTFVIDGKSQKSDACGTGIMSADGTHLDMEVADAYPGVLAERHLHLQGNILQDETTISCDAQHTIDWIFHAVGHATFQGDISPATLPESDNGYDYLSNVRKVEGDFSARFIREEHSLEMVLTQVPEGATIYLAISPDNPADMTRHTVIVRTVGKEAKVAARYTVN